MREGGGERTPVPLSIEPQRLRKLAKDCSVVIVLMPVLLNGDPTKAKKILRDVRR